MKIFSLVFVVVAYNSIMGALETVIHKIRTRPKPETYKKSVLLIGAKMHFKRSQNQISNIGLMHPASYIISGAGERDVFSKLSYRD